MNRYFKLGALFCAFFPMLWADGISDPKEIFCYTKGMSSAPFACFNSKTDKHLVTWLADGHLYYSLYNNQGVLKQGPNLLLDTELSTSPRTAPFVSYNSEDSTFIVSYLGWDKSYAPYFHLLDSTGITIMGPVRIESPEGGEAASRVYCCYSSRENEFALAWATTDGRGYLQLVNADGEAIGEPVEIPLVEGVRIDSEIFVSHNDTDNHFFLTWRGEDGYPYYAVFNGDGSEQISTTRILWSGGTLVSSVRNVYNSLDKQYLITWVDRDFNGVLAIYSQLGVPIVESRIFASSLSKNEVQICSIYSLRNYEYVLVWYVENNTFQCAPFDGKGRERGNVVEIIFRQECEKLEMGDLSLALSDNSFFIPWCIYTKESGKEKGIGYAAIYKRTILPLAPPEDGSIKSMFNRFANYGEHFNRIEWRQSPNEFVQFYKVYRRNELIAIVSHRISNYEDHNQLEGSDIYSIVAVDRYGTESPPLVITF